MTLFERGPLCDAAFFVVATLRHAETPRSRLERAAYMAMWRTLLDVPGAVPDHVIFLNTEWEECLRRQKLRDRAAERDTSVLTPTYMQLLELAHFICYLDLHESWERFEQVLPLFPGVVPDLAGALFQRLAEFAKLFAARMSERGARIDVVRNNNPTEMQAALTRASGSARVFVVGNIAAGKSTLLDGVATDSHLEPLADWVARDFASGESVDLLHEYYQDAEAAAFPFQVAAFATRALRACAAK